MTEEVSEKELPKVRSTRCAALTSKHRENGGEAVLRNRSRSTLMPYADQDAQREVEHNCCE